MQYSAGHKYELHISVHKYMLGFSSWTGAYHTEARMEF